MDKEFQNASVVTGKETGNAVRDDGLVWLSLTFLNNIKILAIGTLLGTILFAIISFVVPKVYRAEVKLLPSTRLTANSGMQLPSGLRGASALMGFNIGGQDQDLSRLFGQLVKTRSFAEKILQTKFATGVSDSTTLAVYLDPDFVDQEMNMSRLARRFASKVVKVQFDEESGVITLAAALSDRDLAVQVANLSGSELDDFYRRITQEQQEKVVTYLDDQLTSALSELRSAEEGLQNFLAENRSVQGNPYLEFEMGRLRRTMEIREEVFLNLSAQFELAKFEYYRNMPSIIVISQATRPLESFKPNRPLYVGAGFVVSFFAVYCVLLFREGMGRLKNDLAVARS